jgi:hypothetical protein
MDTFSKATIVVVRIVLLLFVLVVLTIFLMKPPGTSSVAQVKEERVFENAIPKDVPIKIKIKTEKERSFKDLKNEKWLSQFELELTNTGDKPIYFIYITMGTGVKWGGTGDELVSPLHYGRAELGDIVTRAGPDDVPIKPGETFVLKMGEVPGWEMGVRQKLFDQSKKLRAELQVLSFGDGTGYFGTEPYPPPSQLRQPVLNGNPQAKKASTKPPEGTVLGLG